MVMDPNYEITLTEIGPTTYDLLLDGESDCSFSIDSDLAFIVEKELYEGNYFIIPSTQQQILATTDKYFNDNIVVDAIPSNYGLITWNGSVLTVS